MPSVPSMESPYQIQVRNSSMVRVGEIRRITGMKITPRFNNVGSFELTLPMISPKSSLFEQGGWMQFSSDDGELLAGQIRGIHEVEDENNIGGAIRAYGLSAEQVLADRLAYQVPTSAATSQSASAYDVRSGIGETIIKQYVNLNAGPGALAARRVTGLTIETDVARGSSIKASARMDNLLELIAPLAQSAGLGFRVVFIGDALQFQMYVPSDKTATAKFGLGLRNLVSYERTREAAKTNCAIIGGQGDLTARVFREINDTTAQVAWSNRTETFIDRRDSTDTVELDQAGTEEVVTNGPVTGISIKTQDTPRLQFGRDYYLGDRVSIPDKSISDILREVEIDVTADKAPTTESTVGTAATTSNNKMLQLLDHLNKKVAALEAKK